MSSATSGERRADLTLNPGKGGQQDDAEAKQSDRLRRAPAGRVGVDEGIQRGEEPAGHEDSADDVD